MFKRLYKKFFPPEENILVVFNSCIPAILKFFKEEPRAKNFIVAPCKNKENEIEFYVIVIKNGGKIPTAEDLQKFGEQA